MCRVKSFLGCISLETFGLFLGWTGFVLGIVIAVPLMFLIVFGLSEFGKMDKGDKWRIEVDRKSKLRSFQSSNPPSFQVNRTYLLPGRVVIGVCIITLVLCCLFVYVCLELINGIETVSQKKL